MPMKPIHHHISSAISANDKVRSTTIFCGAESCSLRDVGKCVGVGAFPDRCPKGRVEVEVGFTKRARKYKEWIAERSKKYANVPKLQSAFKFGLSICDDVVYLPYPQMWIMDCKVVKVPAFSNSSKFVPIDKMTPELVFEICSARPQALLGGEIRSYQSESVPLFLLHLKERMPELAAKVVEEYPQIAERMNSLTHVGREAVLSTLNPSVGTFVDIHKGEWSWDGEFMTSLSSEKIMFGIDRRPLEIRIKPRLDLVVTVTNDAQVMPGTEFRS